MRPLVCLLTTTLLLSCTTNVKHAPCGRVLRGGVLIAWAGSHCGDSKPNLVVSTTSKEFESRCEGGLDENDTFHARGTAPDGGQVDVTFEFSEGSALCNHGKGVLRIKTGGQIVIADEATFSAMD